ncbi:MAG: sensor histidine kinase [Anaerolinea sp.]|nr:sensor histidine kinase [Anaerolinea sp.]
MDQLFERLPIGLALIDQNYNFVRYNLTWQNFIDRYAPLRPEQIEPGKNLFSVFPGEESRFQPHIDAAFAGRVVQRENVQLQWGSVLSYWDVALFPFASGEVIDQILVMAVDASDRVFAYQMLEKANQMLELRVEERTQEINRLRDQAEQAAIIAERGRIARELHDAVTQTLFSASLIAEVLPRVWQRSPQEGERRLAELRQLTRGALAEMRTLLLELRPTALTEVSLSELVRQLGEALAGRARIPVNVECVGQYDLPPDVQITLYRIAQEALNNIFKHADAASVTVRLVYEEEKVCLTITDDGRGFDPQLVTAEHMGLAIMGERIAGIGGHLIIESQTGFGTTVCATWRT